MRLESPALNSWRLANKVAKKDASTADTPSIAHVLWLHFALTRATTPCTTLGDTITAGVIAQFLRMIYSVLRTQLTTGPR